MGSLIVTLTVNPALDRTLSLAAPLQTGEVQAVASAREDAGGKGINVARAIAASGRATLAVLPLAAEDPFGVVLRRSGLPLHPVPIEHPVRVNTAITDPAGVTTKLNLPGARLSSADRARVIDAVVEASRGADWLVLAGSLPPGAGDDFYVDVIALVRSTLGAAAPRIAVDTSGEPLRRVVRESHPDLIKPNDEELADLCGITGNGDEPVDEALALAATLVPGRVAAALVTLGSRGALLLDAQGALVGAPPPIEVVSTVGAGDSSLAGYLIAETSGQDREERLRSSIRYGAAAASLAGTQAPTPEDLPSGTVSVQTTPLPA